MTETFSFQQIPKSGMALRVTEDGNVYLPQTEPCDFSDAQLPQLLDDILPQETSLAVQKSLIADRTPYKIKEILLFSFGVVLVVLLFFTLPASIVPTRGRLEALPSYQTIYNQLSHNQYDDVKKQEILKLYEKEYESLKKVPVDNEKISMQIQLLIGMWMLKGDKGGGEFCDNEHDPGIVEREMALHLLNQNMGASLKAYDAVIHMLAVITNHTNWKFYSTNDCYYNGAYYSLKKAILEDKTKFEQMRLRRLNGK